MKGRRTRAAAVGEGEVEAMFGHVGQFQISLALLRDLLQLPAEATVRAVGMDLSESIERFTVFVEHPDLPGIEEDAQPPEISPVWKPKPGGGAVWYDTAGRPIGPHPDPLSRDAEPIPEGEGAGQGA